MSLTRKKWQKSLRDREYAFSLSGLFFINLFAATALVTAASLGPVLPLLIVLPPLPPFLYVFLIRRWMLGRDAASRERWFVDLLLFSGLLLAVANGLCLALAIVYYWGLTGI